MRVNGQAGMGGRPTASAAPALVRGSRPGQNPVLPIVEHLRQSQFNREFFGAMSA